MTESRHLDQLTGEEGSEEVMKGIISQHKHTVIPSVVYTIHFQQVDRGRILPFQNQAVAFWIRGFSTYIGIMHCIR